MSTPNIFHKFLAVDIYSFEKLDQEGQQRQGLMFQLVSVMVLLNSSLLLIAVCILAYFVFQSWAYSFAAGSIFFGIMFILYRLILITAMICPGTIIGDLYRDHRKYFSQVALFDDRNTDVGTMTNEQLDELARNSKERLVSIADLDERRHSIVVSDRITTSIRVIIISLFAIICSSGIQILIFRSEINDSIENIKTVLTDPSDRWIMDNIFSEGSDRSFGLVNCKSILVTLEILSSGLGLWKLAFDIGIITIFLIPLMILYRSREVGRGILVRTNIIEILDHSFRMHLYLKRYEINLENKMYDIMRTTESHHGM